MEEAGAARGGAAGVRVALELDQRAPSRPEPDHVARRAERPQPDDALVEVGGAVEVGDEEPDAADHAACRRGRRWSTVSRICEHLPRLRRTTCERGDVGGARCCPR